MNRRLGTTSSRRRGAVLIEFILLVPLIGLIITLTYFFGYAMRNQQRVKVAARYHVWRHLERHFNDEPIPEYREAFYYNLTDGGTHGWGQGPAESLEDLVEATSDYNEDAHDLAEDLVMDHFPRGRAGGASAEFPARIRWDRYTGGAMHGRHTRDGLAWRRGQTPYLEPIRDLFLQDLDDEIMAIDHAQLRANIRAMYLKQW